MTSSINRCSLVKGAALTGPVVWAAPAVANASSAPSYATSQNSNNGNQVTGGMFVSVQGEGVGTNSDLIYVDMNSGSSGNGEIDRNWSVAQDKITDAPASRNTNGSVTSYGTLGGVSTIPGQVPSRLTVARVCGSLLR